MRRPTREQWTGYALLCVILAVALLLVLFLPFRSSDGNASCNDSAAARLKAAVSVWEAEIPENSSYTTDRNSHFQKHTASTDENLYPSKTPAPKREFSIELNSADTLDLQLLHGIGPVFANRIVRYRNLLGGFVRKEQLMEVYGMTPERYNMIAGHISVDPSHVKKIDINNAPLDEIRRHPYIDYYQAKAILIFRQKGRRIDGPDDMLKINLIDSATVIKINGYIQYD